MYSFYLKVFYYLYGIGGRRAEESTPVELQVASHEGFTCTFNLLLLIGPPLPLLARPKIAQMLLFCEALVSLHGLELSYSATNYPKKSSRRNRFDLQPNRLHLSKEPMLNLKLELSSNEVVAICALFGRPANLADKETICIQ